jgi:GT2 family glycosyltransferase
VGPFEIFPGRLGIWADPVGYSDGSQPMIVPLGQTPSVVAIIPTLGTNEQRLRRCIASLDDSTGDTAVGVVVVWNSLEAAPESILGAAVLAPGLNLGFPGALNHGRSRVDAAFIWVIQDDLTVRSGCLAALMARLAEDDQLAVVAPVTIDNHGRIPHVRAATLTEDRRWPRYPPEGSRPDDIDPAVELGYVVSSGSLARVNAWDEVGGYDPSFFPLYWADVDFCHRLRLSGWKVALVPDALIDHQLHGSAAGLLRDHFLIANEQRLRDKHFADDATRPRSAPAIDVDPELLAKVAVVASTQLVDFYRFASGRLEMQRLGWKLRHPIDSLRLTALSNPSTRWMVVRLLAVRSKLKRCERNDKTRGR